MTPLARIGGLAVLGLGLALGCDKDDQAIRTYDAPKDVPPPVVAAADTPAPPPPADVASAGIQWTLPDGWKQVAGQQSMRYATIQVDPADAKAVLTVVALGGQQDVEQNLHRWAGQVKLPADADLIKFVKKITVAGDPARRVQMAGPPQGDAPPQSILVVFAPHQDKTWFFKIEGPQSLVEGQAGKFDQFVGSIKFAGSDAQPPASADAGPAPAGPADASAGSGGIAKFTAPTGWRRDESPATGMIRRLLSFKVGPADQAADASVIALPVNGFGDWHANINRWRGQVGLGPVDDVNSVPAQDVQIGGEAGRLFDFANPQNGQQMLVGYAEHNGQAYFFKLTGPAGTVAGQKPAFADFLKSIQFE